MASGAMESTDHLISECGVLPLGSKVGYRCGQRFIGLGKQQHGLGTGLHLAHEFIRVPVYSIQRLGHLLDPVLQPGTFSGDAFPHVFQ